MQTPSADNQEWREVPGFPNYLVSSLGRVFSIRAGRELSLVISGRYPQVTLHREGVQRTRLVHHLVLEAFAGQRQDGMVGMHLNDNPLDNRRDNLAWGTPSENNRLAIVNGKHPLARRTHCRMGHEFTPENTYLDNQGRARVCRICRKQRNAIYYRENRHKWIRAKSGVVK